MRIIGHRGAAGLALENTLPSFELARLLGIDAIELDVRQTGDDRLVVCHDADISRVSDSNVKIGDITLKQLQAITLADGQSVVPTLEEALDMIGTTPVIIELKDHGIAKPLLNVLASYPKAQITIASFKLTELAELRQRNIPYKLYGLERTRPFDIIQFAKELKLDGVGLNFWLLNPLTYFLLRRAKLDTYVYTINNRFFAWFVRLLYPQVGICTDHPEWFIKHPYLKLRSASRTRHQRRTKRPRKNQLRPTGLDT
jgi:glycerophosphoryl diester phosphodiesterase